MEAFLEALIHQEQAKLKDKKRKPEPLPGWNKLATAIVAIINCYAFLYMSTLIDDWRTYAMLLLAITSIASLVLKDD
jgi:hypothetical protein